MWHSVRAQRSDSRIFFGLHLHLAGRCCKNPLIARDPAQCKSDPEITCLVRVTIYCAIFSITIHFQLASFYGQNTFKKIARENAH